ncbi:GTPase IMAP family member 8-like protein [Lates japonicus]|uniref:GTPase IMAP family member 8-like protein n=1 Tax=Lates japonicus TaxID=270547 RepID=A0AAD3NJG4_LATJO|nr:GTPase IMAP family member 8-like protein [Lates japonicus]
MIQSVEERRKEVDIKAEELRLKTRQQRQKLRNLLTEPRINLRVLMLGWVFSGKSAAGNRILSTEVFQSGERTMKVLKQSGKVAGREVTELLEKMEEMVAGNSSFYLSETDDPQPEEDRSEESNQNKDEDTAKEITEQLNIEWDRRNWEKTSDLKRKQKHGSATNL